MSNKPIKLYDEVLCASVELNFSKEKGIFSAAVGKYETTISKGPRKGCPYPVYVVVIHDKNDFYTLLHECVHLAKNIFVDRHIPFIAENDEVLAYYIEWWFKTLWRECHKKGK